MRRVFGIALYALLFGALTVGFPLFVSLAALRDVVRSARFASARVLCFAWVYLGAELLGVIAAGWIWLTTSPRHQKKFREENSALQAWWADLLLRAVKRTLAIEFVVERTEDLRGPILLFIRHASIIDTLLPAAFIARPGNLRLRYVLKRELLVDPCLEIVGRRLPNYFVDRAGETQEELAGIAALGTGLERDEGVVIYPEGTRFSKAKRARALAAVARKSPHLLARSEAMTSVLPPRLGGPLALLSSSRADVVFCAHVGLEGFATVADMFSGSLVGSTVRVHLKRFPRAEIPDDSITQVDWLFDRWAEVDRFCGSPHSVENCEADNVLKLLT